MYSRDYLDDYDPSSTYSDAFATTGRTAAERRKNDWKYAERRREILRNEVEDCGYITKSSPDEDILRKPLPYYAKNSPWKGYALAPNKTNNKGSRRYISKNYAPQKNWNEHDKRQIDNFENQLKELLDEE